MRSSYRLPRFKPQTNTISQSREELAKEGYMVITQDHADFFLAICLAVRIQNFFNLYLRHEEDCSNTEATA